MASAAKLHYLIELDALEGPDPWLEFDVDLRTVARTDIDDLAALMLDAYRGTVDYQGESLDEARAEVEEYFEGSPRLDTSYLATVEETPAGAILTATREGEPLVSYVMTRPEYKNQGLATLLLRSTLRALRDRGEDRVHAFITEGNTASEALFRGAGARMLPAGG